MVPLSGDKGSRRAWRGARPGAARWGSPGPARPTGTLPPGPFTLDYTGAPLYNRYRRSRYRRARVLRPAGKRQSPAALASTAGGGRPELGVQAAKDEGWTQSNHRRWTR